MPDQRAHLPSPSVAPGEAIGPYRIASVLADGPSGTVYEAVESPSGRRVALRHLPGRLVSDSLAQDQLLKATGQGLGHPNVVAAVGVERHGDQAYLVMEFIGG